LIDVIFPPEPKTAGKRTCWRIVAVKGSIRARAAEVQRSKWDQEKLE
jgi:hypothetical protein